MSSFEEKVFNDKSLADVFSDIYRNTDNKRGQIEAVIKKLMPLVATLEDAVMIAPILRDFIDVNVKNDEHLIRVAQIIQRIISVGAKPGEGGALLTDAEKEQLLSEVAISIEEIQQKSNELDDELSAISNKNVKL